MLRVLASMAIALVLLRHMAAAARTFRFVPGSTPGARIELIPLAGLVLMIQSASVPVRPWLMAPGFVILAGSLALFERARRSIEGRFFSYAFSDDPPEFLWTSGPYAYIRNPFYASYLLGYAAAALMFLSVVSVAVVVVMTIFYRQAARREEQKFQAGPFADDYRAYCRRAGRFFPRLRR